MRRILLLIGVMAMCTGEIAAQNQPEPVQPAPQNSGPRLPPGMQLKDLGFRDFNTITTDIRLRDDSLPTDYSKQLFDESQFDQPPPAAFANFYWDAPEIWHRPLYFDDVQLERYGQTPCPQLQPVFSAAHFFGSTALLPYKMGIDPPFSCVTNLGYYRPGSPAPCVGRRLPWEADAAAYEAGTILGLIFLLP